MSRHRQGLRPLALVAGLAIAFGAAAQSGSVAPCPLEQYKIPQWAKSGDALRRTLEADLKFAVRADEPELVLAVLCAGAAAGEPFAEVMLGAMVATGKLGLKADPAAGRRWLERAAGRGDAQAQHLLSDMYISGHGGPVKIKEGMDMLHAAARGGNVEAQFLLGLELVKGNYAPRDFEAARRWLQEAARGSHPQAVTVLRELEQQMGAR